MRTSNRSVRSILEAPQRTTLDDESFYTLMVEMESIIKSTETIETLQTITNICSESLLYTSNMVNASVISSPPSVCARQD